MGQTPSKDTMSMSGMDQLKYVAFVGAPVLGAGIMAGLGLEYTLMATAVAVAIPWSASLMKVQMPVMLMSAGVGALLGGAVYWLYPDLKTAGIVAGGGALAVIGSQFALSGGV